MQFSSGQISGTAKKIFNDTWSPCIINHSFSTDCITDIVYYILGLSFSTSRQPRRGLLTDLPCSSLRPSCWNKYDVCLGALPRSSKLRGGTTVFGLSLMYQPRHLVLPDGAEAGARVDWSKNDWPSDEESFTTTWCQMDPTGREAGGIHDQWRNVTIWRPR